MARSISRLLIETVVKKALRDAKDSPERAIRNLVDMAMYFSEGSSQRSFFSVVQELLCNEQSVYYPLIQDVLNHADEERILAFGMNVGYNSCTLGAKQIRSIEKEEGFNVPWSLSLEIDGRTYPDRERAYRSLVEQGAALGIYNYLIFPAAQPQSLLSLPGAYPDCAFTLFCSGEDLTEDFLDEAGAIANLLLVVRYGEDVEDVCSRLRSRGLLYSIYIPYGEQDVPAITSGEYFACAESLHSPLTVFVPINGCPAQARRAVYDYVTAIRKAPVYRTVPWEALHDGRLVDSIISDEACSTFFDRDGILRPLFGETFSTPCDLFHDDLRTILKAAFPKGAQQGAASLEADRPISLAK